MWLLFPNPARTVIHRAEHHAVLREKPVVAMLGQGPIIISDFAHVCELRLKCTVSALGRCRRRQHRKGFFVHLKINRAITG